MATTADPGDIIAVAIEEAKRIHFEALRAAELEHRRMVAATERRCEEMLAAASREAAAIVEAARMQAERSRAQVALDSGPQNDEPAFTSAQVVLEIALEESRRIHLAAIDEAKAMREAILARARAEADAELQRASERGQEALMKARAHLESLGAEVQRLQEALSLPLDQVDKPEGHPPVCSEWEGGSQPEQETVRDEEPGHNVWLIVPLDRNSDKEEPDDAPEVRLSDDEHPAGEEEMRQAFLVEPSMAAEMAEEPMDVAEAGDEEEVVDIAAGKEEGEADRGTAPEEAAGYYRQTVSPARPIGSVRNLLALTQWR